MKRKKYASDISRARFAQIEPVLRSVRRHTKPTTVDLYEVFCAVLYVLRTGCQWRFLPSEWPKWQTVYSYFAKWNNPDEHGISVLEQAFKNSAWRGPRETGAQRLRELVEQFTPLIAKAPDVTTLLTDEARLTKALFKLAVEATGYGEFSRAKRGTGTDPANRFLDHGNYLAYGLGATATWVLGLPHGLAVLHGKTRRGGLVFDAADLVKDAAILPQAFLSAMRGDDEQQFRQHCIQALAGSESLDFMIDMLKTIALDTARHATQGAVP